MLGNLPTSGVTYLPPKGLSSALLPKSLNSKKLPCLDSVQGYMQLFHRSFLKSPKETTKTLNKIFSPLTPQKK